MCLWVGWLKPGHGRPEAAVSIWTNEAYLSYMALSAEHEALQDDFGGKPKQASKLRGRGPTPVGPARVVHNRNAFAVRATMQGYWGPLCT
jgi:hypothetical protein